VLAADRGDGRDPQALANAAARALSVGRPHAARDLADLVERIGGGARADRGRPGAEPREEGAAGARPAGRAGMMKAMGTDIGTIHFVGIGGIGMSGIAEVMHQSRLQGAGLGRRRQRYVVERLRKAGIPVAIGHSRRQSRRRRGGRRLDRDQARQSRGRGARAAPAGGAPRRDAGRADAAAKDCVAVAGTHGKTTTTSMIAALLDAGGLDPTVINGGIINAYGTNARLGAGDWMVVEADESDGSFLKLDGTIAVVTNIDPEHLDHYGTSTRSRTRSSSSSRTCRSTASP
jgi:UDP-N-acetylmuramate-alanine ligase